MTKIWVNSANFGVKFAKFAIYLKNIGLKNNTQGKNQ